MAQVTQRESQKDEDFRMTDEYLMNSDKSQVIELIHLARIDRDALDAEKALAAKERAMYESRIASIETLRDTEVEWINTLKKNHHEKDRVIITMLSSHLPVDKAAETVALFKSKDEQLIVQGRIIDAYRTWNKCGFRQMAELLDTYRNSLTDQADNHRTEITDLYDRVTKLVEEGACLKVKLKRAKSRPTARGASKAALLDKDAEIARLNKAVMAAKDAEKAATLSMGIAMMYKDAQAAAVIAAKDAEITRLTEELAAARGLAAMET
jgi:hypothetical protein